MAESADLAFDLDVAISFAGAERDKAKELARLLEEAGLRVFYDHDATATLWGEDLFVYFDDLYRKRARYCVIFISSAYATGMWTIHERQSAQARLLAEKGQAYVLPISVDDTELPGLPSTIGWVSLREYTIAGVADLVVQKLASNPAKATPPHHLD